MTVFDKKSVCKVATVSIFLFLATRSFSPLLQVMLFAIFTLAAVGLADRAERTSRIEDPSFVVIDEIVGMWTSLLFLWRAEGAFPKKGIRQDGGDIPKMRTCHCERSEAIFSIEIASSLALLAMTYLLR